MQMGDEIISGGNIIHGLKVSAPNIEGSDDVSGKLSDLSQNDTDKE